MSHSVRLQKFLADSGVASRRKCEELIVAGAVEVDGRTVRELGTKIDPENAKVKVQGKLISQQTSNLYIAFYKPRGVLSTMSDDRDRPCLGDYFSEREERLFHVGRLDKESEGLLLLTNDGNWAHRLSHPSFETLKVYYVGTEEEVTLKDLRQLTQGIKLIDGIAKAERAEKRAGGFEIALHEGRNQMVRRMASALGLTVTSLVRVQVGRIHLGELKSGKWRYLSDVESL